MQSSKVDSCPESEVQRSELNSVSEGGGSNTVCTASVSVQIVRKWSRGVPWVGFEE